MVIQVLKINVSYILKIGYIQKEMILMVKKILNLHTIKSIALLKELISYDIEE